MAQEVLTYKVEVDQSDLATQLADIKNQIDTALGSLAFNRVIEQPSNDPLIGRISDAAANASMVSDQFAQSIRNSQSVFTKAMDAGRLGFQKFTQDVYNTGLVTPPEYAQKFKSFESAIYSPLVPGLENAGTFKSLWKSLGFGYDKDMRVTMGAYQRLYHEQFAKQAGDLAVDVGLMAMGPEAGIPLEFLKWGAEQADIDGKATRNLAHYINYTSMRNRGRISFDDSMGIARNIRQMSLDPYIRSTIGDATDIENMVAEFTNVGGFLDTRTPDEYRKRAMGMVRNSRAISYLNQSSLPEALQNMATLIQKNIVDTPGQALSFNETAAAIGAMSGYRIGEVLNFAMQGAEMTRGTAYGMSRGAKDAMSMLGIVRNGFSADLLQESGGSQQVALSLQNMAYSFANSPSGRLASAANIGGLPGGIGTVPEIFGAAATAIGSYGPGGLLKLQTKMRENAKNTSSSEYLAQMANTYLQEAKMAGIQNITAGDLQSLLISQGNFTELQARQATEYLQTDPNAALNQYEETANVAWQTKRDMAPGWWNRDLAIVGSTVVKRYNSTLGAVGHSVNEDIRIIGNHIGDLFESDATKVSKLLTENRRASGKISMSEVQNRGMELTTDVTSSPADDYLTSIGADSKEIDRVKEVEDALKKAKVPPEVLKGIGIVHKIEDMTLPDLKKLQVNLSGKNPIKVNDDVKEALNALDPVGNLTTDATSLTALGALKLIGADSNEINRVVSIEKDLKEARVSPGDLKEKVGIDVSRIKDMTLGDLYKLRANLNSDTPIIPNTTTQRSLNNLDLTDLRIGKMALRQGKHINELREKMGATAKRILTRQFVGETTLGYEKLVPIPDSASVLAWRLSEKGYLQSENDVSPNIVKTVKGLVEKPQEFVEKMAKSQDPQKALDEFLAPLKKASFGVDMDIYEIGRNLLIEKAERILRSTEFKKYRAAQKKLAEEKLAIYAEEAMPKLKALNKKHGNRIDLSEIEPEQEANFVRMGESSGNNEESWNTAYTNLGTAMRKRKNFQKVRDENPSLIRENSNEADETTAQASGVQGAPGSNMAQIIQNNTNAMNALVKKMNNSGFGGSW